MWQSQYHRTQTELNSLMLVKCPVGQSWSDLGQIDTHHRPSSNHQSHFLWGSLDRHWQRSRILTSESCMWKSRGSAGRTLVWIWNESTITESNIVGPQCYSATAEYARTQDTGNLKDVRQTCMPTYAVLFHGRQREATKMSTGELDMLPMPRISFRLKHCWRMLQHGWA